jgi:hypothetical protein
MPNAYISAGDLSDRPIKRSGAIQFGLPMMALASVTERDMTSVFILVRPKSHKIAVSASLISMFVCERDELVDKGKKIMISHTHALHIPMHYLVQM